MTKTVLASVVFLACVALIVGPAPTVGADEKKPAKAPLIDAHVHVWGDDEKKFPFDHPYEKKFTAPKIPASVDRVVKEMDEHGVTHCVLVQTIYHGWDNRYLIHCLKAHPKRFRGQGLLDPTDAEIATKFEKLMKEPGMTGIRLSPIYYVGKDEWLDARPHHALWKKADELGAVFNLFIAP